jgi:5-methylcytosine-specific restriction endonuclease McrA
MSQLLSVELPEDVYERVRRAATATKQPMEKALAAIVRGATPSLDKVPSQYRAELEAMEILGDDDLVAIARAGLTAAKQRRLADLLHKNQQGRLTTRQESALAELQSEGSLDAAAGLRGCAVQVSGPSVPEQFGTGTMSARKSRISQRLRERIAAAAAFACGYCLTPERIAGFRLTVEHIIPEAKRGKTVVDNLWLACHACNGFKAAQTRGHESARVDSRLASALSSHRE